MKHVHLTDTQWELFYGALIGLRMPGVTGEAFYRVSPLIQEAVDAVAGAEDGKDPVDSWPGDPNRPADVR